MKAAFFIFTFLFSYSVFSQTPLIKPKGPAVTVSRKVHKGLAKAEAKKTKVTLLLTHTSSYCGGAEPSPEEMAEYQKQKPYAEKKIYIKKGDKNIDGAKIVFELIADKDGKVEVLLAPGKYFIVDDQKKDRTLYNNTLKNHKKETPSYSAVDKKCLDEWFQKPELVFEVNDSEAKDLKLNFHHECSWYSVPCAAYHGDLPP